MFTKSSSNIVTFFLKNSFNTIHKRRLHKTHYDILKLSKNCTSKEIKEAFIQLSKEYHPDKTSSQSSQKHFVKVLEAYHVLSKPISRRQYDWELEQSSLGDRCSHSSKQARSTTTTTTTSSSTGYGYEDPSFWVNRNKSNDKFYQNRPYYGVPGVQRVPNSMIAFMCILICMICTTLQFFAIRNSFTLKRDFLKQQSDSNELVLNQLKTDVANNSKELQIELVEQRLLNNKHFPGDNIKR